MATNPSIAEQEKIAAEKLRLAIRETKILAFDYMKFLIRCTPEQLVSAGHRAGLGMALQKNTERALEEIERMIRAHEKQFPG